MSIKFALKGAPRWAKRIINFVLVAVLALSSTALISLSSAKPASADISVPAAGAPCVSEGPSILTLTQQVSNGSDLATSGAVWATDSFTENINIWLGSDNSTYCAQATVSNGTFTTTGTGSPQNNYPLSANIDGTFNGGETYILSGLSLISPFSGDSTGSTVVLPANSCGSDSCANGAFSDWVTTVFGAAPGTGANYVQTFAFEYNTPNDGSWVDSSLGSSGDIASIVDTTANKAYATLQSAVSGANAGDTIYVAPGTYSGDLTINKSLTLEGAQYGVQAADLSSETLRSGNETEITSTSNTLNNITVKASNVTINGFTVDGPTSTGKAAIYMIGAYTNNNIEDNIFNAPGRAVAYNTSSSSFTGNAVSESSTTAYGFENSSGAASNVTISDNLFTGGTNNAADVGFLDSSSSGVTISNNVSDGASTFATLFYTSGANINGNAITNGTGASLYIGGANTNTTVESNTFTNDSYGVYVDNYYDYGPNSGVTISSNTFDTPAAGGYDLDATTNSVSDTINASNNYWGSTSPDFTSLLSIADGVNLTYAPYYTNSDMTLTSDGGTILQTNTDLTAGNPNVIVDSDSPTSTITIPNSVSNPTLDLSQLSPITSGSTTTVTIPSAITVNSTTTSGAGSISVQFPANLTITADNTTWNGVLNLPQVSTYTLPTSTGTASQTIEIGLGDTPVQLSQAVSITFSNQSGELVGFEQNGVFTPITTSCNEYLPDLNSAMPAGGDCYTTSGSDLIVWTKHFTTFVTYAAPASTNSSSSKPSSKASTIYLASANQGTSPAANSSANPSSSTGGQVLGAHTQKAVPALATTNHAPVTNGKWYEWLWFLLLLIPIGYAIRRSYLARSQKS